MDEKRRELPSPDDVPDDAGWVSLFEDRYGVGAQDQLLELLRQPCVTFASIAKTFGVTRECVRQWHRRLLPGAPLGHERQQQCRLLRQRRRLFQDPTFLAFYRRIRAERPAARLTLIPSRDGFRKRAVRVDGELVALARAVPDAGGAYTLPGVASDAGFVYYELGPGDFLFMPRWLAPSGSPVRPDRQGSPHQRFTNTFEALSLPDTLAAVPTRVRAAGGRAG